VSSALEGVEGCGASLGGACQIFFTETDSEYDIQKDRKTLFKDMNWFSNVTRGISLAIVVELE
jgi:hypothetical protein